MMKRVMCLRFLNWPVQRLERQQPNDPSLRLALHTAIESGSHGTDLAASKEADVDVHFVRSLFPAARSGPTIVCVSQAAWQAGVRPGMPLAEARSMAAPIIQDPNRRTRHTETTFEEWLPRCDRKELKSTAELLRTFAPIIAIDESAVPDSLLLDVTGCGQLFGGESTLAEQLVRRLYAERYQVRVAISDTVASAWAFAHGRGHFLQVGHKHFGQRRSPKNEQHSTPIFIVPPGQAETWLADLPLAAARLPLKDADVLFQLGVLSVRQLLALPMDDLPARLSKEAITRIRQLRGLDEELISPIPEADPVQAEWSSEFPATDLVQIQQILHQLTERIAEQLVRRQVGAVRLDCQLDLEDRTSALMQVEMVKPVQESTDLNEVLRLRLDQTGSSMAGDSIRQTLARQPVSRVLVKAVTAPLPVARQKDLFSTAEHIRPSEEMSFLINRLTNRLGSDSVVTIQHAADLVPEKTIDHQVVMNLPAGIREHQLDDLVSVGAAPDSSAAPRGRPLRLLSDPILLTTAEDSTAIDSFSLHGRRFTVAGITGPERIQTQWWQDTAVHRDYFRVTTSCGCGVWVFKDLRSGEWLLHGFFD